ncbi:MAG: hypothetical protein RLZZ230_166 [Candidatus Parcubacteria bacterium]|jgi:DNA-binding response OmpR family regulator
MKKKILIIEDDSMLLSALIEWFSDEGYDVRGSSSVEDAFVLIDDKKPDVILTDLVMANLDGFEVLERVNETPDLNDVQVIIISNSGEDKDVERALALGAKDFIIKSDLSLKGIVERVKKVISDSKRKSK